MTQEQALKTPYAARHHKHLGSIVCGPHWTLHSQSQRLCLTMIDPASSWFEIVKPPVTTDVGIPIDTKGQKGTKTHKNTKLPVTLTNHQQ